MTRPRLRAAERVLAVVAVLVVAGAAAAAATTAGRAHPAALAGGAAASGPPALPAGAPGPTPPVAGSPGPGGSPVASPLSPVSPLGGLIEADLFVRLARPADPALVQRLVATTGATRSLLTAAGPVDVGSGRTLALAVDPSSFRAWTAGPTAKSDPLWREVAAGSVAVAHAVAQADAVDLGGTVRVRGTRTAALRVGALATTGLPGVGVVTGTAGAAGLGLVPRTALLLSAPGRDPAVLAALAARALGHDGLVQPVLSATLASGAWTAPVRGVITSPFGLRIHPITHQRQFHEGVDIGAPIGTPVYAMTDGQVLYAGAASGFGQEVVLQHAGGVTTVYGHVSQLLVTSGAVRAGQPIALVGNEGESTGPHLHAEVRVQDQPVDPVAWLVQHGVHVG